MLAGMSKTRTDPIVRLMARVVETPGPLDAPCWVVSLAADPLGYSQIQVGDGVHVPAHRLSYEHHVGPIPEGLYLDHLCHVRRCINPAHLEPVTPHENALRRPWVERGPPPTAPHGTVSAYKRHLRHQEPPCEACRAAWAAYHRGLYMKRVKA